MSVTSVTLKFNLHEMSADISFPYNADLVALVKLLPDREFIQEDKKKFWRVPIQDGVNLAHTLHEFEQDCRQLGHQVYSDEQIYFSIQVNESLKSKNLELSSASEFATSQAVNTLFGGNLVTTQRIAVEYMMRNARGVICGNMPEQARASALGTMEILGDYPTLIVCRNDNKFLWGSLVKRLTGKNVLILGEERALLEEMNGAMETGITPAQVVIVNFGLLESNTWVGTIPWRTVIVDEAHYIKNSNTPQAKALFFIMEDVKHRILLSQTDFLASPVDLAVQLELIGAMARLFGNRKVYLARHQSYVETSSGWKLGAPANLEELETVLRSNCYVRTK